MPTTSAPASPRDASSALNRRNRLTSSCPIGSRSGGGVDFINRHATVPEASVTVVKAGAWNQGQQISNPRTGQLMTLISADPADLRLETFNPPTAVKEPMHVHPHQETGAELLSGSLVFELPGERREVGAGEKITIPAN